MSDMNSATNRAVWFDIPVADLDRAAAFYRAVLGVEVHKEQFDDFAFGVLDRHGGIGGCLIPKASEVSATAGILLYLNVDGRIRDAVGQTEKLGGKVGGIAMLIELEFLKGREKLPGRDIYSLINY